MRSVRKGNVRAASSLVGSWERARKSPVILSTLSSPRRASRDPSPSTSHPPSHAPPSDLQSPSCHLAQARDKAQPVQPVLNSRMRAHKVVWVRVGSEFELEKRERKVAVVEGRLGKYTGRRAIVGHV